MTSFPWNLGGWLHWSGKTQDQSNLQWTLQREVLENPYIYGRWGLHSCERDARNGHDSPKPELVVQCCCAGMQEGWRSVLLHWLPYIECENQENSYMLPRIQGVIRSLVGTRYLSCLELKAGFWQIMIDEASKQYTTFTVGNIGFFECKCMLLWLCNSLATFQRLMQNCLGELSLTYCFIYLDAVIIFSKMERNTYITCKMCLSTLGNTTWSSRQPSVNSLRMRSTTWLTMSPRKVYDPAWRI